MNKRILIAILAAALLIPALNVASLAYAEKTGGRTELKRITKIKTSEPVSIDVRLTKQVTMKFNCSGNPYIRMVGAGRATGALLVSDDASEFVWLTQWNFCPKEGCSTSYPRIETGGTKGCGASAAEQEAGSDPNVTYELPPGDYSLLVVADGAPVSLELELPGLPAGKRVLRPTDKLASRLVVPELEAVDPGSKVHEASVGPIEMPNGGLMFEATSWGNVQFSAAPGVSCYSRDEAMPDGPGCLAARELGEHDLHMGLSAYADRVTDYPIAEGDWYSKYWVLRNAPEDFQVMNLWVPFPGS